MSLSLSGFPRASTHSRRLFASLLSILVISCSFALPTIVQAYDGWVYRADLGGWLDVNTGLVWGQRASTTLGGSWSWNGANNIFIPTLRTATGNPLWRLANKGELEDAYLKDGADFFLPPPPPNPYAWVWSSSTKGKNLAFAINLYTGERGYYSTKSYIDAIPVYRAFVP